VLYYCPNCTCYHWSQSLAPIACICSEPPFPHCVQSVQSPHRGCSGCACAFACLHLRVLAPSCACTFTCLHLRVLAPSRACGHTTEVCTICPPPSSPPPPSTSSSPLATACGAHTRRRTHSVSSRHTNPLITSHRHTRSPPVRCWVKNADEASNGA
jgi:hypothetical protein